MPCVMCGGVYPSTPLVWLTQHAPAMSVNEPQSDTSRQYFGASVAAIANPPSEEPRQYVPLPHTHG